MSKKKEEPAVSRVISSTKQASPKERVLTAEGWKRIEAKKRVVPKATSKR